MAEKINRFDPNSFRQVRSRFLNPLNSYFYPRRNAENDRRYLALVEHDVKKPLKDIKQVSPKHRIKKNVFSKISEYDTLAENLFEGIKGRMDSITSHLERFIAHLTKSTELTRQPVNNDSVFFNLKNAINDFRIGVQHVRIPASYRKAFVKPVEALRGYLSTFAADNHLADDIAEKFGEFKKQIDSGLDRYLVAIQNFFTDIKSGGKNTIDYQPVNLVKFFESVVTSDLEGIDFVVDTSKLEGEEDFLTDKDKLSRVFANLIDNAVDAIRENKPDSARIVITPEPSKEPNGRRVLKVKVANTGEIREDLTKNSGAKLFEPGFSTKGKAGKGIGLDGMRMLCRLMGGDLSVDNKDGMAVFDVRIKEPQSKQTAQRPE